MNPTTNVVAGNIYGAYVTGGEGTPSLRAPLSLPVGSVISKVTYYFIDNNGAENLNLNLYSGALASASQGTVGALSTTTSGAVSGVRSTTISGSSYVVPANIELAFGAYNSNWDSVTPTTLTVKGVVVEYTAP